MKLFFQAISAVFHPLFFPTYGTLLILMVNPNLYGHFPDRLHIVWLIVVFALTFLFPVIWLFMMRRLEMIDSLELITAKERIIPFVATATFYLWTTWMFKPNVAMKIPPNELVFFMMAGATLAVFVGFFINLFSKISIHAIAAGCLLGLSLSIIKFSTYDLRFIMLCVIVLAGIIGTARLYLKAHDTQQVFIGYLVGFTGQFISFTIISKFI